MFTVDQIRSRPWKMPSSRRTLSLLSVLALGMLSHAANAQNIQVSSPTGTSPNSSAVWVRAHNAGCYGLTPVAFGYSVDTGSTFYRGVTAYDIDTTNSSIGAGEHTIHFKSWTRGGECPVVDSTFSVGNPVANDITVAEPISNKGAIAPLRVRAHNVGCDGLQPVSFGYSIDNDAQLVLGTTAYDIDVANQAISPGHHTIHFKSWTRGGLCQVVNTSFEVNAAPPTSPGAPVPPTPPTPVPPPPAPAPTPTPTPNPTPVDYIPPYAVVSPDLESSANWEYQHDPGTRGGSSGSTLYPATTPSSDTGRGFYVNYSYGGGELYHISFGNDATATHFVYDSYVYLTDPSQVMNVEMDMNQVMSNGDTVIFGTQCSSYSNTWEFTTVYNGGPHWTPSNIPCHPKTWAANSWHHVQIASHRDDNGVVTYDWVDVDGTHTDFQNAGGPSAMKLGWALGDLLINFQLDGNNVGDGSITAYLHSTVVYHW